MSAMQTLTDDLKRRMAHAYISGLSGTYEQTAKLFGVSTSTVSRILRRARETGDPSSRPKGGNNPRRIDLEWLREHAQAHPDARLKDRADAWFAHSGVKVCLQTVSSAMRAIGWTYKKKHPAPASATAPTWSPSESASNESSPGSSPHA